METGRFWKVAEMNFKNRKTSYNKSYDVHDGCTPSHLITRPFSKTKKKQTISKGKLKWN